MTRTRLLAGTLGLWMLCGTGVEVEPADTPDGGKKGVLRVCDDVLEPASLDPTQEFNSKSDTIVQQMVDGLVQFAPDGKLEPALAERWERVAPDRVRFWLRSGVKFHNGEPFDAKAVKFSVERYVDPATRFPGIPFISTIASVEVEAPDRVVIVTHGPDGLLLNRLAGALRILPPEYYRRVGPAGFARAPVGTGPFEFVSRTKGKCIRLAANPNYWQKGFPKLRGLEFHFLPAERQLGALLKGEIDLLTELPGTRTLDVVRNPRTTVLKNPAFWTLFGSMNNRRKPLSDVRVRRALNLAIDREKLVHLEAMGNARPLASLSMPGESGHNPELAVYEHDLSKARKLLEEAGYPGGCELSLLAPSHALRAAQAIASQLEELGVRVKLTETNAADMIGDVKRLAPDIFLCPCPDPLYDTYFIQWVASSSASPFSLVRDPEFDRRLAAAGATLDAKEREKQERELDRYVYEQSLSLFTYQRIRTYGLDRRVRFVPFESEMHRFLLTSFDGSAAGGSGAFPLAPETWRVGEASPGRRLEGSRLGRIAPQPPPPPLRTASSADLP